MALEPFEHLGLALAIGFLVGVERGWRDRDLAEGGRTAGIRTYALTGLLGGLAGLLGQSFGGWAFAALLAPLAAAFILFKLREQADEGDHSVTAVVAALLVFALGAFATVGNGPVAAASAVVATGLLAFKSVLHTWLRRLTWPELRGALVLLAMSFVALPLLPDQAFGPYASVNPHELWMLTIAMAGVSFLAYAAMRMLGPSRGVVVASLAGALVSSTAVTLYLARLQRSAPNLGSNAGAALLAGAVMAGRLGVITLVVSPPLFRSLVIPLSVFGGLSAILGLWALWRAAPAADVAAASPMKSPFDLGLVVKFVLVLGAVMAATRIISALYGASVFLPVAALGGLADADAVTLAAARLTAQGLDLRLGAQAVLLAAAVATLFKAAVALAVGGGRFAAAYGAATLLSALAAAAATYWAV